VLRLINSTGRFMVSSLLRSTAAMMLCSKLSNSSNTDRSLYIGQCEGKSSARLQVEGVLLDFQRRRRSSVRSLMQSRAPFTWWQRH
jgi:hypothetical protein